MFAVSANARQLLVARPRAPASARGSSRRVAAAARPAAASSSARASDVEATTGAGARAMRAGAALALSAAVAFSSPGPALAALNKKGNSQDAYAEMMAQMEAQRCATTTAPPPTPTRRPIRDAETKNQSARSIERDRRVPSRPSGVPPPSLPPPTSGAHSGVPFPSPFHSLPASRRKAEGVKSMSVESMYEEQGGACGEGYELVTVKVLGASCQCVSDACKDGAKPEGAREVRSDAERAFGKMEAPAESEGDEAPSNGIKFVFTPKD
jgi:hypothetical protein